MNTQPLRDPSVSALPDLLTVEEAARVLRVGRTKAYAMAREWRASKGRSGLPVVDLGDVLRVPRRALEELVGVELVSFPTRRDNDPFDDISTPGETTADCSTTEPVAAIDQPTRTTRRSQKPTGAEQTALFDLSRSEV